MCGIVGVIGKICEDDIESMISTLNHRGPDSKGRWISSQDGVALGHTRLSIQDLSSAGHQPMASKSNRFILSFNGEIYNHLKLRGELSECGFFYDWRGVSDTETILACFERWGIHESLKKFIGMFAISVFDQFDKKLYLIRDRLGEKPLYYSLTKSRSDSLFLFGSELKSLNAHSSFVGNISKDSLSLFMRYSCIPAPYTIYENTFKLEPAHILCLDLLTWDLSIQEYWSYLQTVPADLDTLNAPSSYISSLDELLTDAVSGQLLADVPVGAFLSGGVDSTLIASIMQKISPGKVKTFTIGFDEVKYNEAKYALDVARYLKTDHTELYVSASDAINVIPRLPLIYDEPFADSSQIPTFLVCELAKTRVSVALSGDGGDELFGGYNRYLVTNSLWHGLSKLPISIRSFIGYLLTRISPSSWSSIFNFLPTFNKKWANIGHKIHKGAGVLPAASLEHLYSLLVSHWKDPNSVVLGSTDVQLRNFETDSTYASLSNVEKLMILDIYNYLPNDILVKVDRAAMSVSLETRAPFLDHRIVEFSRSLPLTCKINNFKGISNSKWILRELLGRYVPNNLIDRPKMGFGIPIEVWLRGPLREWAESLLDESRLRNDGYFDSQAIRKAWDAHISTKKDLHHELWNVLMFQAWIDAH